MAEPLKHWFDRSVVEGIEADLVRAGIDPAGLADEVAPELPALELLDRGRRVGVALRRRLPDDPEQALDALVTTFGPRPGSGLAPFRYLPHAMVIAELGPTSPTAGLRACHAITSRFTAEACIRPILAADPERTWAALAVWVHDPDAHVRRLVSEGTRPRLPWAPRVAALVTDPGPGLSLLDQLVDDQADYVRRSVANHLGNVAKDHPDRAVATARRWLSVPERLPVVRHGLRHLVKQGSPGALDVLGFGRAARIVVERFAVAPTARIGDVVPYTFDLVSTGDEPQRLVVDAVVSYRKARGHTAPKVFKLATVDLGPGERRPMAGRLSLKVLSTRQVYPGGHTVEIQVNGARFPGGSVDVS